MLSFLQFPNLQHGTSSNSLLLPFFFALLALAFTISSLLKSYRRKPLLLPPSPPRFPIIGNLHQLGMHPHRSLRALAQTYGPIMLLHLGSNPVIVISSASMAEEIMKTHDIVFSDRVFSRISSILLYDKKDVATAPYGEYWRQIKSICVVHLLSNRRVQTYTKVREEETADMIETIKKSSSAEPVNISEIVVKLTNHVISRVALGRKYSPLKAGRDFKQMMEEFNELLGVFDVGVCIPWLFWVNQVTGLYGKAKKLAKEIDEFLEAIIEEHIARDEWTDEDNNNKDFVDILLWIQKENLGGFPIDRTCIKALILDVFAAGTDTTYTVLEWAMTELLRHPEIMNKVQKELRETVKNKPFISENELGQMQYLKAVIKETLRFHPPIPLLVPRMLAQDVNVKGFDIAARTQVFVNAFAIGRDPESWDRAEDFWPDRFLNSSIDFKGQHFELIPFGSGRRICPGIQFAMSTDELALANLLYKFDWSVPSVENVDAAESTGLSIHRKSPLLAFATPYDCQL